jgi:hypothetical protein
MSEHGLIPEGHRRILMTKMRHVVVGLFRSVAVLAIIARSVVAQQPPITQRAFKAYLADRTDSATALFSAAVRQYPSDARLHAWLAEAALRSSNPGEAVQPAIDALRLDPCNAQAHLVRASLFMPRYAPNGGVNDDSTWTHLMDAVRCDPRDGNAWSYVWKYSIMRGDSAAESRALRALVTTGYLTSPQVTYAEWLLRSLPPRAVLVTGGDMDTYAPLAVQAALGVRRDVAVVNAVMLNGPWYSKPILARHQLHCEASTASDSTGTAAERIIAWLRRCAVDGTLDRPLGFALTAPIDTTTQDGALQLAGPYWLAVRLGSARTDSANIVKSLRAAETMHWRGPTIAGSDRSPSHHVHESAPALIVSRMVLLDSSLSSGRDAALIQHRKQWIADFLRRAGVDRATIDRTLQQFGRRWN